MPIQNMMIIRVFYLSCLINAAVIYKDEEIVETNMEDIEV